MGQFEIKDNIFLTHTPACRCSSINSIWRKSAKLQYFQNHVSLIRLNKFTRQGKDAIGYLKSDGQ